MAGGSAPGVVLWDAGERTNEKLDDVRSQRTFVRPHDVVSGLEVARTHDVGK
jgi:hypothetical protein